MPGRSHLPSPSLWESHISKVLPMHAIGTKGTLFRDLGEKGVQCEEGGRRRKERVSLLLSNTSNMQLKGKSGVFELTVPAVAGRQGRAHGYGNMAEFLIHSW